MSAGKVTPVICDTCGKEVPPFQRAHDCDGGVALRKASKELFGPTVDLVERLIEKAGTGILRGVFEVAYERDRLRADYDALSHQRDELREALELAFRFLRDEAEMEAADEVEWREMTRGMVTPDPKHEIHTANRLNVLAKIAKALPDTGSDIPGAPNNSRGGQ